MRLRLRLALGLVMCHGQGHGHSQHLQVLSGMCGGLSVRARVRVVF